MGAVRLLIMAVVVSVRKRKSRRVCDGLRRSQEIVLVHRRMLRLYSVYMRGLNPALSCLSLLYSRRSRIVCFAGSMSR